MRTCLGCGEVKPKRELVRIVRNADNSVSLDRTGKAPGRGAYICDSKSCAEKLKKNKRLSRQFETAVSDELYDELIRGCINE